MAAKTPPASFTAGRPNAAVTTMKAILQHHYGPPDILAVEEIAKPAVGDEDVLIRVHAVRRMRLRCVPWPFRAFTVPVVLIWVEAITARNLLRGIKGRAEAA